MTIIYYSFLPTSVQACYQKYGLYTLNICLLMKTSILDLVNEAALLNLHMRHICVYVYLNTTCQTYFQCFHLLRSKESKYYQQVPHNLIYSGEAQDKGSDYICLITQSTVEGKRGQKSQLSLEYFKMASNPMFCQIKRGSVF